MDGKTPDSHVDATPPAQEFLPPGPRQCENVVVRVILGWYALVFHACLAIALAISMIYVIDGLVVNSKERYTDDKTFLRASDITTIISAVMVLISAMTASWSGVTAWRCAFVLLENHGLNLQQLNNMITYRIPTSVKGKNGRLVALILLLMLPALFVGPLGSGAVDWPQATAFISNGTKYGSSCAGEEESWDQWRSDIDTRINYVGKASQEFIGLSRADSHEFNMVCRRYLYTNEFWPVGSAIENIILPCIAVEEVSWDTTPPSQDIQDLLQNSSTISMINEPIFTKEPVARTAVILNLDDWRNVTEAPPSSILRGQKKVAMHLGFTADLDSCRQIGSDRFGPSFPVASAFNIPWSMVERNVTLYGCFLIGNLNLTAGVYTQNESNLITQRVVEGRIHSADQIQEDRSVIAAMYLMPDIMNSISDQNLTAVNAWNNLDDYIKDLVSYAYFAGWDAMDGIFCNISEPFEFNVKIAVGMLQADVSTWRVLVWLGINLLFTLSGLVLLVLERDSKRVVINPTAAMITIDASAVLRDIPDTTTMVNLSYITKEDKELGKLKLQPGGKGHRLALVDKRSQP